MSVIVIMVATYVSDQLIYKLLIIPKLAEWKQVPFPWWVIKELPFISAIIVISCRIKSFKEFIALSIFTTLAFQVYGQIAAWSCFQGHLKSYAVEGPVYYWTEGTLWILIFFSLSFAVSFLSYLLCKALIKKVLNAV
jgi:hypothetical protein